MKKFSPVLTALTATFFILTASAKEADPAIDPGAMQALNNMSNYLSKLSVFRVETLTTRETVLENGQKIQYEGNVDALVRVPNGVRIHVVNDRHERLYLYDGKHFTLWGQRINYYATVDAPAKIRLLLDALEENYNITLPLTDLFLWASDDTNAAAITVATDLGSAVVGGTTCAHYAFRQADIDWQVWIQKGDFPLPRRLVITTRTDDARPQFTASYRWDLAPSFNDATFIFEPPEGALRVVLENDSLTPDDSD